MAYAFPITVAIPSYRGAATIREAIESLYRQSEHLLKNTEIIVVDDASGDETPDIAIKAGESLPLFRVAINPHRLGITANWNNCIGLSQGEFVLILHQDDALFPNGLDALFESIFSDDSIGMVFGNAALSGQGPGMEPLWPGWHSDHVFSGDEYARYFCRHGNFIACSSVIYRRSALEETGLFSDRMMMLEDVEMWLRLALSNWKIAFTTETVARMQFHPESAANSAIRTAATVEDIRLLLEKHETRLMQIATLGCSPLDDLKRHMAFQFLGWGKAAMLHGCKEAAITQWREALRLTEATGSAQCVRLLSRALLAFPPLVYPIQRLQKALNSVKVHNILHREMGGSFFPPPTQP